MSCPQNCVLSPRQVFPTAWSTGNAADLLFLNLTAEFLAVKYGPTPYMPPRDRGYIMISALPIASAGQRAMAHAMLYPDPEKGGRGKKGKASGFSDGLGVSQEYAKNLISAARQVLAHSP